MTGNHDVAFRVDAGKVSGLSFGHLFRCLAVAGELSRRKIRCAFVMRSDEAGERLVKQAGHDLRLARLAAQEDEVRALGLTVGGKLLVVDLPGVTNELLLSYRKGFSSLCVFDDGNDDYASADLVVQGHILAKPSFDPPYLRGASFCVLGSQFDHPAPRRSARRIVVTFGGSDPTGLTGAAVNALLKGMTGFQADIILGPGFGRNPFSGTAHAGMRFHQSVSDLARYFLAADLGIAAAGRTAYELAATGTPAILVPSNEHEKKTAAAFAANGAFEMLPPDRIDQDLLPLVSALMTDAGRRHAMAELSGRIVDRQGRRRVADAILRLVEANTPNRETSFPS